MKFKQKLSLMHALKAYGKTVIYVDTLILNFDTRA